MSRILTVLFQRDPSRDRENERVRLLGYRPCWPDGQPIAVGFDAFCKHGLRLFGLGKHLAGCREKLITMVCLPLSGRDDEINRIPGHRVRRFYMDRHGNHGKVYFMDGTPTVVEFEIGRDEPSVLHWVGLTDMEDGQRLWLDCAAMDVEAQSPPRARQLSLETVS